MLQGVRVDYGSRATFTILIGGVSRCASVFVVRSADEGAI